METAYNMHYVQMYTACSYDVLLILHQFTLEHIYIYNIYIYTHTYVRRPYHQHLYIRQCTLYTVYSVQCTMYYVQCTLYTVQCTLYAACSITYNIHCIT